MTNHKVIGVLLLQLTATGLLHAQSAVPVFTLRPTKPYVILQTVTESEREDNPQAWLGCAAGPETPLPDERRIAFISKVQSVATQNGADGLLVVRSGSSCKQTRNPLLWNPALGAGTMPGPQYTHYIEADIIKFVEEEIAERRTKLVDQPVLERRRILQEMYQQTRSDDYASADWGLRSYNLGEFQWAVQFLERTDTPVHQPYFIAALVRDGAEKTAEKSLKKLLDTLKKQPGLRLSVIHSLEEPAKDLPQKWNREFTEVVPRIQRLK